MTPTEQDKELREKVLTCFDIQGSFDDNRPDQFYQTWSPGGLVTDLMELIDQYAQERETAARKKGIRDGYSYALTDVDLAESLSDAYHRVHKAHQKAVRACDE